MSIDYFKKSLPTFFIYLLTSFAGVIMFFVRDTYSIVKDSHEKIIMIETRTNIKHDEFEKRIDNLEKHLLTENKRTND